MTRYPYDPLPDPRAFIRTLTLFSGANDDVLEASIEIHAIDQRPTYEAISYCWGSGETPHELLIRKDGSVYPLPITYNLHKALKRFRSLDEKRVLWNDATCINQKDEHEKKHQVRRMDLIYTSAAKVLVYIGDSDQVDRGVRLLKRIHKAASRTTADDRRSDLAWIENNKLPSVKEAWKWEPLKVFFRSPWFRRVWIIQETVLARQVVFHYGDWTCDWPFMSLIIQTIYRRSLAVTDYTVYPNGSEGYDLQKGFNQIRTIMEMKSGIENGTTHDLLDLASRFQVSEATDKRDHLFSLLGLANDVHDRRLDPDYGKTNPLTQNCLRYARYFLKRNRSLELLYRAGIEEHTLLAPSWVPNWYGGFQRFGFEHLEGLWDPTHRPAHLDIARGTRAEITEADPNHPCILRVRGVIFDTIKELANEHLISEQHVAFDKDYVLSARRRHLEQCDRIMAGFHQYSTGESIEEVQWRTLICNTTIGLTRPDNTYFTAYEAYRRCTLITAVQDQRETDGRNQKLFARIINTYNAAKIFGSTVKGRVGMFPRATRRGDVLAIMSGGEFPFVLRLCNEPSGSEFELVGQCYVHGCMEEGQVDLKILLSGMHNISIGGRFTSVKPEDLDK